MKSNHIMIIAGEASGDMRAAGLARALKELDPSLRLTGIGGDSMRQAGVECFADITQLAVIGIAEVIKNLGRIKKTFDQTLKQIDTTHPDAVILVDYPGFNLQLAKKIVSLREARRATKQSNTTSPKVIYYISPQVWAWREKRILKIKELVDRMIVLFPFEKELYAKYGMDVDYVGHPLVDEIAVEHAQTEILKTLGLSASKTTIGLMPGSRAKEVERHLPCMIEAAKILYTKNPERQFILLKAPSIPLELLESICHSHSLDCHSNSLDCHSNSSHCHSNSSHCHSRESGNPKNIPLKIYDGQPYNGINAMDACMVASGTATLECGLLKKPMVIIYKTSWLTYMIAKQVIKIPCIGLVNIVAGKKVAEELIQNNANATNIANALESALHNPQIIDDLASVKSALGQPGASLRAAQVVLETVSDT